VVLLVSVSGIGVAVVDDKFDDSEEFAVFPVVVLSPPAPAPPDVVVIVMVV